MTKPRLTVLLTVYNAEKHLKAAIDSILAQTFSDFNLLIIDDGSTDSSRKIINSYSYKDSRITPLLYDKNKGFIAVLNEGLKQASTDIVARMDADDISQPQRLQKQYDFLSQHPDIAIVGSDVVVIDEENKIIGYEHLLENPEAIKRALPVMCPFAHGAVMFRKSAVLAVGGYKETDFAVEDYELWGRLLHNHQGANITQPLFQWRVSKGGMSQSNVAKRAEGQKRLTDKIWDTYGHQGPAAPKDWNSVWPQTYKHISLARKRRFAELHILFGRRYFERHNRYLTLQHFWAAIVMYPLFVPFYAYFILALLPYRLLQTIERWGIYVRKTYRGW